MRNLAKSKRFGKLKNVNWVSEINLSKNRETEIRYFIVDTLVEFHYPDDLSDFNVLIEDFLRQTFHDDDLKSSDEECKNILGEKKSLIGLSLWTTSQV